MLKAFINYKSGLLVLIAFSVLLFVHVFFLFCAFYGNDDINYARLGADVFYGRFSHSDIDHFPLRWVTIFAAAVSFKLFGFTEFAIAVFSLSCFIATAVLIRKVERNPVALFYAYVLFFLSFSVIFYSHRLLPDAGICLFVFVAYCAYFAVRFYNKKNTPAAVAFSVALFAAMLTKETVIITLPLWLYLLGADLRNKRNLRFWIYSGLFLLLMIGGYLLFFKITKGDWLFRYHVLLRNSEMYGAQTYQALGVAEIGKRIVYQLWQAFLFNGDFEYLIFAIGAFIYMKKLGLKGREKNVVISFAVLLLSANFMSYSVNGYNPLPPDPRHFLFIIPFAAISGAYMIDGYFKNPQQYIGVFFMFVAASVFLLLSGIGNTRYLYFGITLALFAGLISRYLPYNSLQIKLGIAIVMLCMLLNYLNDFIKPRYPFYFDQKELVKKNFKYSDDGVVYCGDGMTAELNDFFFRFENEKLKFTTVDAFTELPPGNDKQYLLVNGGYDPAFKARVDSLFSAGFQKTAYVADSVGGTFLYKLSDAVILQELKGYKK